MLPKTQRHLSDCLGDLACILSVVGMWPRFVEPRLLSTTQLELALPHFPKELDGLKILHFSDLHLHPRMSNRFLSRLTTKIRQLEPDIILFTGDFLCSSVLYEPDRLAKLLSLCQAPFGSYAVLGNHDYEKVVSVNKQGDYDVIEKRSISTIRKGFARLFQSVTLSGMTTQRAREVGHHQTLLEILKESPFTLLDNMTMTIPVKGTFLNISGLGEYTLGKADPQKAFQSYQRQYPGIVLAHNPDIMPSLEKYPGDLVFCGHTHGGQIHLPWLWRKFTLIENPQLKRGLKRWGNKWVYITRGIGGLMPFRLFSRPELLLLKLKTRK